MKSYKGLKRFPPQLRENRRAYLIVAKLVVTGLTSFSVQARDHFNPAMLEMDNPDQGIVNLSLFEDGSSQAPGTYRVDVYLNGEYQDTQDVAFSKRKDSDGLQPCLNVASLHAMGVKTDLFPALGDAKVICANLSALPQASAEFHFGTQQLLLSIPQAAIFQNARGYVPESQWDEGILSFLLNYSLSGASSYASQGDRRNDSSNYANLRPGINFGSWRLRNYTSYSRNSNGQVQWDMIYTYAQRNIAAFKSQLTLGDSSSPSDVFESIPFRGAQLASDDEMMPDSQKGYAPVVRGIARSNAQIVIRQSGYVIYQNNVSPGAFEINDMFPTGGSGDLHVTIKESDGSEQYLVVPFASLPVLQREGRLKYSFTSGQYRSYDSNVDKTTFSQGTAIYGLPAGFTTYGGGQFASKYQSLSLGVGKNLGEIGALSTDATLAWSKMGIQPKDKGLSWRIRYSKNITRTGTSFSIAGYRYSTDGYYSLQEILDSYRKHPFSLAQNERKRNRREITMTQNLWKEAGALSLSLFTEDYWNSTRTMRSIGAGYTNSWNRINYGINYNYNENTTGIKSRRGKTYDRDQVFSLNISVPVSVLTDKIYASYNVTSSRKSGTTHSSGLYGTALADNNLSWSAQQGYGSKVEGNSGSLNANYRGNYGEVMGSYSYDRNSYRLNYGFQGGMVAHQNGITFGQPLGETLALVKAQGAHGVSISNESGVKTDWDGFAIVPYVSPYRKNQVQLNTETLPDNVDITLSSQNIVPTRGAVVRATFNANAGRRVLMTVKRANGEGIPFGAIVSDTSQKTAAGFIVGDKSVVYLTGLKDNGSLKVKWGARPEQQCGISYSLPMQIKYDKKTNTGISVVDGLCR